MDLDRKEILRRRRVNIAKVVVPFLIVGAGCWAIHIWQCARASDEVARLALRLAERMQGSDVESAVRDQVKEVYGDLPPGDELAAPHRALSRALAYHLDCHPGDKQALLQGNIAPFRRQIFFIAVQGTSVSRATELAFLLFFPLLFIFLYGQAAATLLHPGDEPRDPMSRFTWRIAIQRAHAALEPEGVKFMYIRFVFAGFLGLSILYLFAPRGVRGSEFGELTALQAIPGESSHPFWFTSFGQAPAYVSGIAGFLLYSVVQFVERFHSGSLHSGIFITLIRRGITVMLLSLVVSSVEGGAVMARALCFIVGVFPQAGLQAIGKIAQTTVERVTLDTSSGFRDLPEIDLWKETTLREWGVASIHDLATTDWSRLLVHAGIDPILLIEAADRALLLHVLGPARAARLETLSIATACDLVRYAEDHGEEVLKQALEARDVALPIERLKHDPNVRLKLDIYPHCPPAPVLAITSGGA